jgi:hypothetical protein
LASELRDRSTVDRHEGAATMNDKIGKEIDSSAHYMGIATGLLFVCLFALNAIAY